MRLFLQILIFLFTCFISSATFSAPKIVVLTNTSILQKTETITHSEKAKIGLENFARSSIEEQQAQTTTFHQNTYSLSSYLKSEYSCTLDFQETVSTNQVLFAQFSKKEALCLLKNRAREVLEVFVQGAGKLADQIDNTLSRLTGKAKYALNNKGEYKVVASHHPTAKKAFEGDLVYDYKKAFSVKTSDLDDAWKTANSGNPQNLHAKIIGQQNSL